MAIQFGSTAINAIKYCNASGVLQDVTSVVRNGATVWTKPSAEWTGFKLTAEEDGCTVKIEATDPDFAPSLSLMKSLDGGASWTSYSVGDTITLESEGDSVCIKAGPGGNESFGDTSGSTTQNNHFVLSGSVAASGNIMSLLDATMTRTSVSDYCFMMLFENCSSLTSAPILPATTLGEGCYAAMFKNCGNLRITTVAGVGYEMLNVQSGTESPDSWNRSMFRGTSGSFTSDPQIGTAYYCQNKRTDNQGVWNDNDYGLRYLYDSESGYFVLDSTTSYERVGYSTVYGQWQYQAKNGRSGEWETEDSNDSDQFATSLSFTYGTYDIELTWSAS